MTITVRVIGAPDSELLPNHQRRLHYMRRAATIKEIRERTAWSAVEQLAPYEGRPSFEGPVRIKSVIAWPTYRQRCDFQSAVHALKGAVDALQDANIIADDNQVVGMEITQTKAEKGDAAGWFTLEVSEVIEE